MKKVEWCETDAYTIIWGCSGKRQERKKTLRILGCAFTRGEFDGSREQLELVGRNKIEIGYIGKAKRRMILVALEIVKPIRDLSLVCCPFCSSDVNLCERETGRREPILCFVKCPDCGMCGPRTETRFSAADEWNRICN